MAASSSSTSRSSSTSSSIQEAVCLNRNSPKYILDEPSSTFSMTSTTLPRCRRRNSAGLVARLRSKLCFCHSDLAEEDFEMDRRGQTMIGCCSWMCNSAAARDLRVIHVRKEGVPLSTQLHSVRSLDRNRCVCGKGCAIKSEDCSSKHHGAMLCSSRTSERRSRRAENQNICDATRSATMIHRSCVRVSNCTSENTGKKSATLDRPSCSSTDTENFSKRSATLGRTDIRQTSSSRDRRDCVASADVRTPSSCSSSSLFEAGAVKSEINSPTTVWHRSIIETEVDEILFQTPPERKATVSKTHAGKSDAKAFCKSDVGSSDRNKSKNTRFVLSSEGSKSGDTLFDRDEFSAVSDDSEDEIYESYETTKPEPKALLCSSTPGDENLVLAVYDQVKDTAIPGWSLSGELAKLARHGWYWGPITRVEAEEKLAGQPDGTFLVRDSSDDHYLLSLSFRSYSRTLHTRIEHCNGVFSLYTQQTGAVGGEVAEGYASIVELIERSVSDSQTGIFCYSRARAIGSPSFPVRLTRPVSRFSHVRSLQYLCRFVIRQRTRVDHIQKLPLPGAIKGFLEERQY